MPTLWKAARIGDPSGFNEELPTNISQPYFVAPEIPYPVAGMAYTTGCDGWTSADSSKYANNLVLLKGIGAITTWELDARVVTTIDLLPVSFRRSSFWCKLLCLTKKRQRSAARLCKTRDSKAAARCKPQNTSREERSVGRTNTSSKLVCLGAMMAALPAAAQVAISTDGVLFPDGSKQESAVILPKDCPHSESIVWDTNGAIWVCESDISPVPFAAGDTGPAGGVVFWTTADGLSGLEAAPYDQGSAEWGCSGIATSAVGTAVFAGSANTTNILVACGETSVAARLAANFTQNGYDDWYLPSLDELNQLYLQRALVGGFANDVYWSSSESTDTRANIQDFTDGSQDTETKSFETGVRAVRSF